MILIEGLVVSLWRENIPYDQGVLVRRNDASMLSP